MFVVGTLLDSQLTRSLLPAFRLPCARIVTAPTLQPELADIFRARRHESERSASAFRNRARDLRLDTCGKSTSRSDMKESVASYIFRLVLCKYRLHN